MKKRILLCCLLLLLLPSGVFAAELPEDVADFADGRTMRIVSGMERWDAAEFLEGVVEILRSLRPELAEQLRSAAKSGMLLLIIVLLASLAGGIFEGVGEGRLDPTVLAAVLAMSGIALRDLGGLMQSAVHTLTELESFSKALFPVLSAAMAATGAIGAASVHQVVTVWLTSVLIWMISTFLLPFLTVYIVLAAVAAALPGNSLDALAEGIKKAVSWILTASVSAFTAYLSAAHVISGSADALTLRLTRATLSGAIPVVGSILSGTAETVLAGAGILKNAVGIVGLLGVLSLALLPFLSLLLQYLVCRVAAIAAAAADGGRLSGYLGQLSGAFGLLLAMVGVSALLVLVSVFACVAVVMP